MPRSVKRLTALLGGAALIAALILVASMSVGGGVRTAFAAKSISVKSSTIQNPACSGSAEEWHFVITQVSSLANAPAFITVTWRLPDNSTVTENVARTAFTGGVAHYATTKYLDATVIAATASIYNTWGGQFNLSHGPCPPPLKVTKTATTSLKRTYNWEIDKSVDPTELNLFTGDTGTADYTVTVDKTGSTDSDWAVSGTITIKNQAVATTAHVSGVSDVVPGATGSVTIDCGGTFPIDIAPGGTLNCTYSAATDGSNGTNTATVTTIGKVAGGSGTAAVDFSTATVTEVNPTITVDDSVEGPLGTASDDKTFEYSHDFTCDQDEGKNDNTAEIVETGQTADASVQVNCYEITVSKTAETSLTRTYEWDIDKSVTPDVLNLFTGDTGTANYTVTVDKTGFTDSDWAVTGTITITNPHPSQAATISEVSDVVSDGIDVDVDCGVTFPYDIPAGGSLECDYSTDLPDGDNRTNTATATRGTAEISGTADVDFSTADITEVDPEINVTDTLKGDLGSADDDKTFEYSLDFTCDQDEGDHPNTATIVETGDSATETVTVNCYELEVTKTAETSFTRTYDWTVQKSVDQSSIDLGTSTQSATVTYSVYVPAPTYLDSDWAVSGTVTVHNPAPIDASLSSVTDVLGGLNCPADLTVPAGGDLICDYSVGLAGAIDGTNTATATLANGTEFSGDADYTFGGPTTEVDECVAISDSVAGALGSLCVGDAPQTFTYTRTFTRDDVASCETPSTFDNTAYATANDTGATDESSASVSVSKSCLIFGCSPGYYKEHDFSLSATTMDSVGFDFDPSITFQTALESNGGGINQLLRHSAAAYLNAFYGLSGFPYSTADVISLTNAAIASGDYSIADTFALYNHGSLATGGCPLN